MILVGGVDTEPVCGVKGERHKKTGCQTTHRWWGLARSIPFSRWCFVGGQDTTSTGMPPGRTLLCVRGLGRVKKKKWIEQTLSNGTQQRHTEPGLNPKRARHGEVQRAALVQVGIVGLCARALFLCVCGGNQRLGTTTKVGWAASTKKKKTSISATALLVARALFLFFSWRVLRA